MRKYVYLSQKAKNVITTVIVELIPAVVALVLALV